MVTTITSLPTPPTVADTVNFDTRADAFVAALPTFVTETNASASEINQTALLILGYYATDSASNTVGTGNLNITIDQLGKAFYVNQVVIIYETANPTSKSMTGTVTAFVPSTGAMTINVTSTVGSGTASGWTIASTAPILAPVSIGSVLYLQANFGIF